MSMTETMNTFRPASPLYKTCEWIKENTFKYENGTTYDRLYPVFGSLCGCCSCVRPRFSYRLPNTNVNEIEEWRIKLTTNKIAKYELWHQFYFISHIYSVHILCMARGYFSAFRILPFTDSLIYMNVSSY